ncbi:hypothetical protein NQ318_000708 [Aromia moschata]|uniref:Uncharacterized protein n=1 Tax=Aromia moschata TaxID=1265417 RepID=A0AAV8XU72_9CUCU|nr:hypothetical protein NQ318_000708 [Aromia moschata]
MARLGSIGYPIGPEPILGVPYSMEVSTMKELLNKEFEKIMARSLPQCVNLVVNALQPEVTQIYTQIADNQIGNYSQDYSQDQEKREAFVLVVFMADL